MLKVNYVNSFRLPLKTPRCVCIPNCWEILSENGCVSISQKFFGRETADAVWRMKRVLSLSLSSHVHRRGKCRLGSNGEKEMPGNDKAVKHWGTASIIDKSIKWFQTTIKCYIFHLWAWKIAGRAKYCRVWRRLANAPNSQCTEFLGDDAHRLAGAEPSRSSANF